MSDDRFMCTTAARSLLAFLRLAGVTLLAEAELDGVVADLVLLKNLDHRVGRCLHHGARNLLSVRSEEHTSELQSPYDLVCRLLLEKKKKNNKKYTLSQ